MRGQHNRELAPPPHPAIPGEMCFAGVIPAAGISASLLRDLQKAASGCKFQDRIYLLSFKLVRTVLRTGVRLFQESQFCTVRVDSEHGY